MIYQTLTGVHYTIEALTTEEQRIFKLLQEEHAEARSWTEFQTNTAHMTIETARTIHGNNWSTSPIYNIQLDMLARVGIRGGEMKGTLNEMILEQ